MRGKYRDLLLGTEERPTTLYLPQYAHLARPYEYVIRHVDGGVFAMFAVDGASWEELDEGSLEGLHERLCGLYRNLGIRDRVRLTKYLCRTEAEDSDYPQFITDENLARRIEAGYRRRLISEHRLWNNCLFLGVLVRPPSAIPWYRVEAGKDVQEPSLEDVQALEQVLGAIQSDLGAEYGLRRLGLRQEGRLLFTEPAEALTLVLTGRRKKIPLCRGRLGRAICAHRPVFRDDGVVELRSPGRTDYCTMHGFSVYPKGTDAAMFDHLLSAPYRFSLAQSFGTMPLHEAHDLVTRTSNQFISAGDPAVSQRDELPLVANDLQNREYALGRHNLTLAVFADSEEKLEKASQIADTDMRASGAIISQVDWDIEAGYFGMMPGTEGLHSRSAPITSRNFAAFGAMHGYPRGWRNGRWCDHVALFTTNGGTPFYWNPHVDSEGEPGESPHLFISGPNCSGKTTVLLALIANVMARAKATVMLWDKDRGCKLAVLRMGGEYFEFQTGEDTGLAPLRALHGSDPRDMDFLAQLVRGLILSDDGPPLVDEDERRIDLALRIIMTMPADRRSFSELRAFRGVGSTRWPGIDALRGRLRQRRSGDQQEGQGPHQSAASARTSSERRKSR